MPSASKHGPQLWLVALVLGLLVLGVFGRTMRYPFVPYDDALNLTENPLLATPQAEPLKAIWQAPFSKLYIPVTYTVWLGLTKISGAALGVKGHFEFPAPPFHVLNVLLHLWSTLWVCRLLRLYVQSPVAWGVAAAFFAVHPLHVEAVAWASGGKDTMFGALAWPALWGFVRFCEVGQLRHALWSTLVFGLALLTKPTGVVLPAAGAVLVWAGVSGVGLLDAKAVRRAAALAGLWLLLALPLAWVTLVAQPPSAAGSALPVLQRLVVAVDALGFYLRKALVPWPLGVDYGRRPDTVLSDAAYWLPSGLLLLAVGLVSTLWLRRWLLFPLLFFAVCLAPVLGVVPFDFQINSTVADRYMYLPLIGVAWALALGVDRWVASQRVSGLRSALLGGLLATLAGWTWWQCGYWRDGKALFEHALVVNPHSPLVHHCYGAALVQAGQWNEAAEHFQLALAARPVFRPVLYNLAFVREQQGRLAEAYELYLQLQREIKQWPASTIYGHPVDADPEMFEAPARVARLLKRYDEASELLETAKQLFPRRPQVYWHEALNAADQGRRDLAVLAFKRALELDPASALIHTSYADFLGDQGGQGDVAEQEKEYLVALHEQPNLAEALINLGGLEARQRRFAEAEAHFRRAVQAAPAMALAYVNLGVLLEQTGRAAEALQAYQKALSLDPAREDAKQGLARSKDLTNKGP